MFEAAWGRHRPDRRNWPRRLGGRTSKDWPCSADIGAICGLWQADGAWGQGLPGHQRRQRPRPHPPGPGAVLHRPGVCGDVERAFSVRCAAAAAATATHVVGPVPPARRSGRGGLPIVSDRRWPGAGLRPAMDDRRHEIRRPAAGVGGQPACRARHGHRRGPRLRADLRARLRPGRPGGCAGRGHAGPGPGVPGQDHRLLPDRGGCGGAATTSRAR